MIVEYDSYAQSERLWLNCCFFIVKQITVLSNVNRMPEKWDILIKFACGGGSDFIFLLGIGT